MQKERYDHKAALEMLGSGATIEEVAKKFNVTRQSIYNLIRKTKHLKSGADVLGKKSISNNGETVFLRGKRYSFSEIIQALPLRDTLIRLSDEQLYELAFKIIEMGVKAPNLEKQVKELRSQLQMVDTDLKKVSKEASDLKHTSLKQKIVDMDVAVLHGD